MNITHIKETCLYVTDLDKTSDFYHGKLGFPIIAKKVDRHIFFRVGQSVLLCFIAATTKDDTVLPPHFASGHQHLAFQVSKQEYEHHKSLLKTHKIEIIHEEKWSEGIKSFYFLDPDKHVLEIVPEGMWD